MPDTMSDKAKYVYRVDKFVVPEAARDEFIERVRQTHALLQTLPGFRQDFVLENVMDNGKFNIVTIVEWESQADVEYAKQSVFKYQQDNQFNPQDLINRLGIQADRANYSQIGM